MAMYKSISSELQERNTFAGVRLVLAADVFIWLSFLFAYVYLRALDTNNMWHPSGINASGGLGGATVAALVVAAAAAIMCGRHARAGAGAAAPAALALAAVIVAAVLQAVQTFNPG